MSTKKAKDSRIEQSAEDLFDDVQEFCLDFRRDELGVLRALHALLVRRIAELESKGKS